jgi:hypothetical protein
MAGGICEFTSIKFARHEGNPGEDDYDVFVVRADCKGRISTDGEYFRYTELFEISTSESLLSRRFLISARPALPLLPGTAPRLRIGVAFSSLNTPFHSQEFPPL